MPWRASTGPDHRERAVRRRALRRTTSRWSTRPVAASRNAGYDDRRGARRPGPSRRSSHPRRGCRRSSGGSRSCRSVEVITTPCRQDRAGLRAEPGRPAAHRGRRDRPAPRSPSGTPRCSSTASSAPGRCARPRRPTSSRSPATASAGVGAASSRSTASATPRSSGWPGEFDPAAVDRGRDPQRHGAHRLVRDIRSQLVNQLHENVVWGMRGNFLYVPTDCPQRDERLGWTGDIQVFAPTASFLYDVRGFLDSWLRDLALEQERDGRHRPVRRAERRSARRRPAAAWGDAATVVPWVLHERYADIATLERQYPSMRAWVDALARDRRASAACGRAGSSSATGSTRMLRRTCPRARRPTADIVASAYLVPLGATPSPRAAQLLGNDDGRRPRTRRSPRRCATRSSPSTSRPSGRMVSDAQTAYAHGDRVRHRARRRSVPRSATGSPSSTRRSGYRIGTGFVGTPIIQDALTRDRPPRHGAAPAACRPRTRHGCTRSRWARRRSGSAGTRCCPDGTINPGEMTSFNHYALGAVGDWLHRVVAGLAPDAPGYARIRIAPHPLDGLRVRIRRAPHAVRPRAGRVDAAGRRSHPHRGRRPAEHDGDRRAARRRRRTRSARARTSGSVDAAAATTPPSHVGLDSSLAAVIDDPEAYAAILEVLEAGKPRAPRTRSARRRSGCRAATWARRSSSRPVPSCRTWSPIDSPS